MNGVYLIIALVIGFGLAQVYLTSRQGELTEDGWRQIRAVIASTIDDVIALYLAGRLGAEEVLSETVRIVKARVDGSSIPAADKAFWTEERIRRFVTPVLEGLLRQAEVNRSELPPAVEI